MITARSLPARRETLAPSFGGIIGDECALSEGLARGLAQLRASPSVQLRSVSTRISQRQHGSFRGCAPVAE